MTTKSGPTLPIADQPYWDLKSAEGTENVLTGIPDSRVCLLSLKQSRDGWLYRTFPKFSSKAKGKAADAPPPHTIQARGKCDVVVGPHTFPETVFYEVNYLSHGQQTNASFNQPTYSNPYWQSSTSYGTSYSQSTTAASSSQPAKVTSTPVTNSEQPVSTPLISSLSDSIQVTPGLISQVNSAASANPILSNLLQLAAAGKATEDQLKTLGLLIQSFANLESLKNSSASTPNQFSAYNPPTVPTNYYSRPYLHPPAKDFDLVLEFRETPNEKWIFPRVPVYGERKFSSTQAGVHQEVSLLTCIPFNVSKESSSNGVQPASEGQYHATLVLKDAPNSIWDTIYRWIGGDEKNKASKIQIESVVPPPRMYLGYQLPQGSQLTQIQAACAPTYTMKLLKQGPIAPTTRAPRKRQRKEPEKGAESAAVKPTEAAAETIVVKRARATHSRSAPPIQCLTCKKTDVPLILGGKFCRPCAEIERQKSEVVPPPPPPLAAADPTQPTETTS